MNQAITDKEIIQNLADAYAQRNSAAAPQQAHNYGRRIYAGICQIMNNINIDPTDPSPAFATATDVHAFLVATVGYSPTPIERIKPQLTRMVNTHYTAYKFLNPAAENALLASNEKIIRNLPEPTLPVPSVTAANGQGPVTPLVREIAAP